MVGGEAAPHYFNGVDIFHRLGAKQDAAGEHEAAIQFGRRLVFLDPLSEFGQRVDSRLFTRGTPR